MFGEPLYQDAVAVAYETMRRARHNIEILIPRLVSLGYQFGYGWVQPAPDVPLTTESRREYLHQMGWAREQYPIFVPATAREELLDALDGHIDRLRPLGADYLISQFDELRQTVSARPTMRERIARVEHAAGRLPLSIAAWYEIVGSVNFVGYHPGWMTLLPADPEGVCAMYQIDPMVIAPLEASFQTRADPRDLPPRDAFADGRELPTWSGFAEYDPVPVNLERLFWLAEHPEVEHTITLVMAEWPAGKYYGGPDAIGIEVRLPQRQADARLLAASPERDITFVEYLRRCFRWGGFPGWQHQDMRPDDDLAALTKDLLSI